MPHQTKSIRNVQGMPGATHLQAISHGGGCERGCPPVVLGKGTVPSAGTACMRLETLQQKNHVMQHVNKRANPQ